MIIDRIENANYYFNLSEDIKTAFEALVEHSTRYNLENITKVVENDISDIFIMKNSYETDCVENKLWETHEKYIDIQFMVRGKETIGYAQRSDLTSIKPYDNKQDIEFFTGEGQFTKFVENYFIIFFPNDAHMPGVNYNEERDKVYKLVAKVRIRG